MHYCDYDWFENNGKDLYDAIDFVEHFLRKHHIGVCGKEKYGTYRDEFLRFWDGGIYQILFGNRVRIGTFHKYEFKENENDKFIKQKKWFNKEISPKIVKFVDKIHHFIYFKIDLAVPHIPEGTNFNDFVLYYNKRKWLGLTHYSKKIGLLNLVHKHQANIYNKAFQLACNKWPIVQDELIAYVSGYRMIKPCKWGNIDGVKIHNKYWTKI